jgi:transposase
MSTHRHALTNQQWERLQPLLPPQQPKTGRPALDHRRMINGIRWILRTGAPWRDLPERYGPWQTVASRLYRWRKAGIWDRLFAAVQQQADARGQLDWDLHCVDGTVVRAHQHAAGANKGARMPKPSAAVKGASAPQSTSGQKEVAYSWRWC